MDAFSSSASAHRGFRRFRISTHSTPLIRQILTLNRPSSWLKEPSKISFRHEFICTISSVGLHAIYRRAYEQKGANLVLWVHRFGFLLDTDNEDETFIQQKSQEITRTFSKAHQSRNLNKHRRWATRLPNTVQRRPQR